MGCCQFILYLRNPAGKNKYWRAIWHLSFNVKNLVSLKSESLSKTEEFYLLVTNLEVLTFVQTLIYFFFLLFCLLKCAKLSSIICYKTRNSVILIVHCLPMAFQGFILRKLGDISKF